MDDANTAGVSEKKDDVPKRRFSFKVNRKLFPVKVQYFIFLAALGCALPYRTVFVKQLGFSGTAIGTIFTIAPFVKIITNPLCGAVVDYSKSFRLANIAILILVAGSHVLLVFVPPLTYKANSYSLQANIKLVCNHKTMKVHVLDSHMNVNVPSETIVSCSFQCFLCSDSYSRRCKQKCNHQQLYASFHTMTIRKFDNNSETILIAKKNISNSDFNAPFEKTINHKNQVFCFPFFCGVQLNCTAESCSESAVKSRLNSLKSRQEFTSFQFWFLLVLITISASAFCANLFLMDAACYEILDDQPDKYGEQRLWGAAGFGIGSLIGGYINDLATKENSTADYTYCFYALAVMSLINILPVAYIKVENIKYSQSIFKDVGKLLCNIHFLIYIFLLMVSGMLSGLIWNYLAWFLEEIGGSPLLLGVSVAAECFLSELPCFLIAGWVVKKVGHMHCMSIMFLCFGMRYIGFTYLKNPWLSLLINLLHGPTYGLFYSSVTSFGKEKAPPGVEATMQAILSLSFEGLGTALGLYLGGVGMQAIGSRATFWYAGITSFAFFLLSVAWSIYLRKVEKQDETTEEDSAANEINSEISGNQETRAP